MRLGILGDGCRKKTNDSDHSSLTVLFSFIFPFNYLISWLGREMFVSDYRLIRRKKNTYELAEHTHKKIKYTSLITCVKIVSGMRNCCFIVRDIKSLSYLRGFRKSLAFSMTKFFP